MRVIEIINELRLFSDRILTRNPPVSKNKVEQFERRYNLSLPMDYKEIMYHCNGFDLMGTEVYGLGEDLAASSIEKNYEFEHNVAGNPMFSHLIPFSPDGFGNHYCFDCKTINSESCDVIFWQHDYPYTSDDLPEVSNKSFLEWIKEVVIDWTLEDYDYNGNDK